MFLLQPDLTSDSKQHVCIKVKGTGTTGIATIATVGTHRVRVQRAEQGGLGQLQGVHLQSARGRADGKKAGGVDGRELDRG